MAIVTTRFAFSEGSYEARIVYDDANAFPEDEGTNIDTCDLVEIQVDAFVPIRVLIKRGNGVAWREVDVTPGSYTYAAGGPVRQVEDIPYHAVVML